MARRSGQGARHLLVWFHVLTSVGWMALALSLCTLLIAGTPAALDGAEVLDVKLLQHLATSSAFSGLMLAALTQWGYLRYWWVFLKLLITVTQLYVGIFILSPRLSAVEPQNTGPLILASALMASAIAFQAWLSVAKPWRFTPWAEAKEKMPQFPQWMYFAAIAIPAFDFVFWRSVFGAPAPIVSLLVALGFPLWRKHFLSERGKYGVRRV